MADASGSSGSITVLGAYLMHSTEGIEEYTYTIDGSKRITVAKGKTAHLFAYPDISRLSGNDYVKWTKLNIDLAGYQNDLEISMEYHVVKKDKQKYKVSEDRLKWEQDLREGHNSYNATRITDLQGLGLEIQNKNQQASMAVEVKSLSLKWESTSPPEVPPQVDSRG